MRSNQTYRCLLFLIWVSTPLLLGGCSWFKDEPPPDPFVESRFTPGVRVWWTGSLDGYRRFMVDEVDVQTVEGVMMDEDVRARIAEQFRREVVVHLANRWEVVGSPGAGVLRMSLVVRGVRPGEALGLAGAWVESTVSDSLTGQVFLTVRDARSHASRIDFEHTEPWEAARVVMLSWADAAASEVK